MHSQSAKCIGKLFMMRKLFKAPASSMPVNHSIVQKICGGMCFLVQRSGGECLRWLAYDWRDAWVDVGHS
jgi:hypothetical protein